MKVIWKYGLNNKKVAIYMPKGAEIIAFRLQNNIPHLWAIVDLDRRYNREGRYFDVIMAGEKFEVQPDEGKKYIGTVQNNEGFAFHLFERINKE